MLGIVVVPKRCILKVTFGIMGKNSSLFCPSEYCHILILYRVFRTLETKLHRVLSQYAQSCVSINARQTDRDSKWPVRHPPLGLRDDVFILCPLNIVRNPRMRL